MTRSRRTLGSARALACRFRRPRQNDLLSEKVRERGFLILVLGLFSLTSALSAATLQEQIDAAAPNDTIHVAAGVHAGPITIAKPLLVIGAPGAEIRGNGSGNVITITADHVTVRGFRITHSGLRLSDDNAALFVAGNRATIEQNVIEDSLHGVYLKKVRDARVIGNRIRGKTTLLTSTQSIEQTLTAGIGELCEVPLNQSERGNGIHQWSCENNLLLDNEISDTRDGIYFSFTNHSTVERNRVHDVRYGLHYMYSDNNVFENNSFSENAAGAAVMFSHDILIRGNRFVDNRGARAYGILFQSDDRVRFENNVVRNNAVGLSFQQAIAFVVRSNDVSNNYIGLRFYGNSGDNSFSENRLAQNLHPIDAAGAGYDNRWAVNGVGNFWSGAQSVDLNSDGINDLPHRELDLFGKLRQNLPAIALLSESPAVALLRFANERAAIPGVDSITDPAPLAPDYWTIRAQRATPKTNPTHR
jgi:nitrous oxidase accessory protein